VGGVFFRLASFLLQCSRARLGSRSFFEWGPFFAGWVRFDFFFFSPRGGVRSLAFFFLFGTGSELTWLLGELLRAPGLSAADFVRDPVSLRLEFLRAPFLLFLILGLIDVYTPVSLILGWLVVVRYCLLRFSIFVFFFSVGPQTNFFCIVFLLPQQD